MAIRCPCRYKCAGSAADKANFNYSFWGDDGATHAACFTFCWNTDINPSQLPDRQQAKGDALESIATQISANCNASYVKGNDQCVGVPETWGRNPMQFRLAKIVFASAGWRQSNAQQSRATSRPPADFHSRSQQSLKRAESSSWPENATH